MGISSSLLLPPPRPLAQVLWQSPGLLPAAIALLAVLVAAVLWLYPPQTRRLPRTWRWAPAALRVMSVAALAVSVVRPAVLRPRTPAQQGTVVVLVDQSHSMSVSDRGRAPADLVALAAGLGALPPEARQEAAPGVARQLDALRARLDRVSRARGEADYARLSGRGVAAAQARLRDAVTTLQESLEAIGPLPPAPAAAARELPQRLAELKQFPPAFDDAAVRSVRAKLAAATAALASAQAAADARLFDTDPQVRAACIGVGRLTRAALAERALAQPGTGLLASLPAGAPVSAFTFDDDLRPLGALRVGDDGAVVASGARSDITGMPREAVRRIRGRAVQAVVLLSDGRQVGGDDQAAAAADLSALGAPLYAVPIAPPGPRRDVSVTAVSSPDVVRAGETFAVRVDFRAAGFVGQSLEVRLDAGDDRQARAVTVGEEAQGSVEFEMTARRAGPARLAATVLPVPGEISDENNRAERWLKVSADPLRVTVLVGADAGRQHASLHDALSRAPWVAVRELDEQEAYRLTPAAIRAQDVVVLCDLPPGALSEPQWDALDRLVRQRGGTVLLLAGAQVPAEYVSHASAWDWLPFDIGDDAPWRTWPGGEPHFRLVPDRADAQAAAQWPRLPPVSRVAPVARLRQEARAVLAERESGEAVMTESARGAGRVIYLGTDEAWRWRGQPGAGDAFWPQLFRRAGAQPYAASEQNLWLDAAELSPEPGRPVKLRARVLASDGAPADAESQLVHVLHRDETIATATLTAAGGGDGNDGRYEGELPGLPAGDYVLRLDAPPDPSAEIPPDPVTLPLRVAPNLAPELADLSGDERLLRRMAESSGGQLVPLEQVALLPRLLAEGRERQAQLVEYPLWDSPWLFGFVLACLSTEWALRKKFGLA